MSRESLEEMARLIRIDIIRSAYAAPGATHEGPALSIADICAVLYFEAMRLDPQNPAWPDRDRFVLSKGHGYQALYSALARRGFFDLKELETLRHLHSILQGHPDMRKTPGVDATSGSLGNGLGIAVGMALAGRLDRKDYDVFVVLGDGEIQEGSIWEAAMAAAHYGLSHLIAFVDRNGFQSTGTVNETMRVDPLAEKWRAFGWNVEEIDGHDVSAIAAFIQRARCQEGRPSVAIAHTVKGKGVSFMENNNKWHMSGLTREEMERALVELGAERGDAA
ncbi:MAG: transketolase [Bacillota bacterium]|nr:transketolase [Bacillota bacterium]